MTRLERWSVTLSGGWARLGAAVTLGGSSPAASGSWSRLERDPSLTPDQVKAALLLSASQGPVGDPFVDGHGIVDVPAALAVAGQVTLDQAPAAAAELSDGALAGSSTLQLAASWSVSTWNPANWSGAAWNGAAWNASSWG